MAEGGERTEAATPKRQQKAREDGRVALSREAAPAAMLAIAALALTLAGPGVRLLTGALQGFLQQAATAEPVAALRSALWLVLLASLPLGMAAAGAASLAVLGQTGGLLHLQALRPDPGRLDPRRGLSRLLGPAALGQLARSLVKLGLVAAVAWRTFGDTWPGIMALAAYPPGVVLARLLAGASHLLGGVLAVQAAVTALDVLWQRRSLANSLRMTRQEVREEHRESEGDPHIKARVRRLRLQRARKRMMQAVPTATVVVVNPTHYAVALAYQRGSAAAPRVVAKGVDSLAARIRAVAADARVPVISNPPLARALWRVELDSEIPGEFFQAVAEIIATVWRLHGGRGATRIGSTPTGR